MTPTTTTAIPAELRERPQWVCWRIETRDGKPTKIPVNARTGETASSTDPTTWTTYEAAKTVVAHDGIGYVFAASDPYSGIDLDHCRDPETGTIEPWATTIITRMSSYAEVSPSRSGVHILIKAKVPPGGNRKGRVEIYSEARYFTMTGEHLDGTPLTIEDRQTELDALHAELFADRKAKPASNGRPTVTPSVSDTALIEKAKAAKNGAAFSALWSGDTSGYDSASEADLALCTRLAFWTGRDAARIDTLFRQSGLYREKWDRADYRERTINAAIANTSETYKTKGPSTSSPSDHPQRKATPFPVEALPPVLRQFAEETAAALPVAVDMVGAAVLAAASGAVGMTRLIRLKGEWAESAAINIAIVAPSGAIKTPMLGRAAAPLRARQTEYAKTYRAEMMQHDADLAAHARALDAYRKQQTDVIPEKPDPPTMRRTWTADVTVERMAGLLSENPRGLALIRDELSAWVKSLNQYRSGKGADKQFYLSTFSNAPVSVDRQGKPPILIDRPFLSVVGNIPPDVLPDLNDESGREDGFLPRILFAYPDPVPVRWSEAIVSPTTEKNYHDLIERLCKLDLAQDPAHPAGECRPVVLDLTPEARTLFVRWHDEHCAATEAESLAADLRPFYAKLKGYCARLALIHAVCTNSATTEIPAESIGAAADLIDYFKAQAHKVAPLLIRTRASPETRCEREIVRALNGGHPLTRREIQRAGNTPTVVFNEVFGALVTAGQLTETTKPGARGILKAYLLAED